MVPLHRVVKVSGRSLEARYSACHLPVHTQQGGVYAVAVCKEKVGKHLDY